MSATFSQRYGALPLAVLLSLLSPILSWGQARENCRADSGQSLCVEKLDAPAGLNGRSIEEFFGALRHADFRSIEVRSHWPLLNERFIDERNFDTNSQYQCSIEPTPDNIRGFLSGLSGTVPIEAAGRSVQWQVIFVQDSGEAVDIHLGGSAGGGGAGEGRLLRFARRSYRAPAGFFDWLKRRCFL